MLRLVLLLGIALNLGMIGVQVFLYRPLLRMPGAGTFVVKPVIVLIIFALLVFWAARSNGPVHQSVLLTGATLGLITGALQIVHMTLENFVDLGRANGITTLAFMFSAFLLWGIAGYRVARSTASVGSGLLAGSWSAIVCMLIVVTFGFVLMYWSVPSPEYVATWSEFKSSGWTDARAFAIANTLDSGFSHLLIGPIVGAVVGGLAGVIAPVQRKTGT
jgi:hypothetical protein